MRRFRRPCFLLSVIALFVNTACYAYQPVRATPARHATVRFHLTEGGTSELARHLGPNVTVVTGQLTDVLANGTLVVAPQFVKTSNGVEQPWSGEGSVPFPQEFLVGLEQRVFNRNQTIATTAFVTAGVVALAITALKVGGASGNPNSAPGAPPP